ncbi:MAG: sugar ABC transporter ATP-binding protein [Clostridia bacterium]
MKSEYYLSLSNISKTFPGVKALDNVRLNVRYGEIHALVGENGAGKSTLIKILSGVYSPDPDGSIRVEGELIRFGDINESMRRGISVIYQDLCLFQNLTVAENICIGKEDGRLIHWRAYRDIAARTLTRLNIKLNPGDILGNLSIANQQLVAIARAIAYNSKLIIMDEPTASLSRREVQDLFAIIRALKTEGIAILFISHKLDEIKALSDMVTVLRDGKCIGSRVTSEINEQEIIQMMVGRTISYEKLNQKSAAAEKVMLEVSGLGKAGYYKDISFCVKSGEILGITGLVGSGRTEVIQTLFGIHRPDSGIITLDGKTVKIRDSSMAKRLGVSYVPEDRQLGGLVMEFDVYENMTLVNYEANTSKIGIVNRKRIRRLTEEMVSQMDVRPRIPSRKVREFSGGNQQKIVIGKWLATHPKVLLVDEPTYGVDIGSKVEIHKLLRGLAEKGMAIVVVSSELQEVLTMTDRIVVMRRGRIVAEMNANVASQESIMRYALMSHEKEAAQ